MLNLTPAQTQAVVSDAPRTVVVAGAGSGKTRVVEHRVRRLIGERTSAARILAITFTNRAANEMRERLEASGQRSTQMPLLRTFHGFCVRVVRSAPEVVHRTPGFWILDEDDVEVFVREAARRAMGTKTPKTLKGMFGVPEVRREYQRLLRAADAVDFDTLEAFALEVLRSPKGERRWRGCFTDVIVDEYQDTNAQQAEILDWLAPERLFVVGDPRQSIYAFRGANVQIMQSAMTSQDWTTIDLADNFRSDADIVALANVVCHNHTPMVARRPAAGAVVAVDITRDRPDDEDPLYTLPDVIRGLLTSHAPKDICLLAHRWSTLRAARDALADLVPVHVPNSVDSVWSRPITRGLLAMSQLVLATGADHLAATVWSVLGDGRPWGAELLKASAARQTMLSWMATRIDPPSPLMAALASEAEAARNGREASLAELFEAVSGTLSEVTCHNAREALDALPVSVATCPLREIGEHVAGLSEVDAAAPDTHMRALSVHSSKGLEFPVVVLLDANDATYRDNDDEMQRVLYVALTRAKDRLVVLKEHWQTAAAWLPWSDRHTPTRSV